MIQIYKINYIFIDTEFDIMQISICESRGVCACVCVCAITDSDIVGLSSALFLITLL